MNLKVKLIKAIVADLAPYRANRLRFPTLVNSLDISISEIQACDPELGTRLRAHWLILEEVNALALDEEQYRPLSEHVEIVREAITDFDTLLASGSDLSK